MIAVTAAAVAVNGGGGFAYGCGDITDGGGFADGGGSSADGCEG